MKYSVTLTLSVDADTEEDAYRKIAFETLDSLNDGENLEIEKENESL